MKNIYEEVNNSLCPVCGSDHNVLIIGLENGGRIITPPFPKRRTTRVKPLSRLSPEIFWQEVG